MSVRDNFVPYGRLAGVEESIAIKPQAPPRPISARAAASPRLNQAGADGRSSPSGPQRPKSAGAGRRTGLQPVTQAGVATAADAPWNIKGLGHMKTRAKSFEDLWCEAPHNSLGTRHAEYRGRVEHLLKEVEKAQAEESARERDGKHRRRTVQQRRMESNKKRWKEAKGHASTTTWATKCPGSGSGVPRCQPDCGGGMFSTVPVLETSESAVRWYSARIDSKASPRRNNVKSSSGNPWRTPSPPRRAQSPARDGSSRAVPVTPKPPSQPRPATARTGRPKVTATRTAVFAEAAPASEEAVARSIAILAFARD
jgi:hypothetical protein